MRPCDRFMPFALVFVLAALPSPAPASTQAWFENPDAGELPGTAQVTAGMGSLISIDGDLSSANDADLFCIRLASTPPVNSVLVSLQCASDPGPNVWLFNSTGLGVQVMRTCQGGEKALVETTGNMAPGVYYVGVSYTGREPQSAGGAIWQVLPGRHAPDGPGAAGAVIAWAGTGVPAPVNPYHLQLAGAFVPCDGPVGVRDATWGQLKIRYRD